MTAQPVHGNVTQIKPPIPEFEGAPVESCAMSIAGRTTIEDIESTVVSTDDRIRLIGEYRVKGVRFEPDKNGALVRVHVLEPLSVQLCPWDPQDPNDDGIVRARP